MNELTNFSVDLLDEEGYPEDSFNYDDLSEAMDCFNEFKDIIYEGQTLQLWFRDPEDQNNLFMLKQLSI
jgi:hypothetical protein